MSISNKNHYSVDQTKSNLFFSISNWVLRKSLTEPVDIRITSTYPINLPNFKLKKFEREEIGKQTNEMLNARIVVLSNSPYKIPVLLLA